MSLLKYAVIFAMYTQSQGEPAPLPLPEAILPPVAQEGRASWYGDGQWHGAITASGEPFDPHHSFTCAHRTLPFDTVVLIENPSNGHRVWCRINDRGPYGALDDEGQWGVVVSHDPQVRYRGILDMSIATAQALETTDVGIKHVALRYWPHPPHYAPFNLAIWMP